LIPWIFFYFSAGWSEGFAFPKNIYINDWHKELEYTRMVKVALMQGEFPFHVHGLSYFFMTNSSAFLAHPIYPLSIQSFLLIFLEPMTFHIWNHLLLFLIGFYGCYLVKKEYDLGWTSFLFLTVTFNLYGGFVTKISAYGPGNLGYYFLPFIIYILFRLSKNDINIDKRNNLSLSIYLALVLSAIIYQGSLHYFVHSVTLLILWGIFNFKHIKFLLLTAITTILLSAARLLPAALIFGGQPHPRYPYGYGPDPEFFLQTFVSIKDIFDPLGFFSWWEYSNYISIIGFGMVFYFVFTNYFFNRSECFNAKSFLFPLLIIFVMSFINFRLIFIPSFVPIISLETVTSRYMVIICLFLIFITAINFDRFFKSLKLLKSRLFFYLLIVCHVLFLYVNTYVWSLQGIQKQLFGELPLSPIINPLLNKIINKEFVVRELQSTIENNGVTLFIENDLTDLAYIYSFYIGLSISVLTAIGIIIFFFYQRRTVSSKA